MVRWLSARKETQPASAPASSSDEYGDEKQRPVKWSLGILNDKETDEVPGQSPIPSVLDLRADLLL